MNILPGRTWLSYSLLFLLLIFATDFFALLYVGPFHDVWPFHTVLAVFKLFAARA